MNGIIITAMICITVVVICLFGGDDRDDKRK